jgi:hypothetical protein
LGCARTFRFSVMRSDAAAAGAGADSAACATHTQRSKGHHQYECACPPLSLYMYRPAMCPHLGDRVIENTHLGGSNPATSAPHTFYEGDGASANDQAGTQVRCDSHGVVHGQTRHGSAHGEVQGTCELQQAANSGTHNAQQQADSARTGIRQSLNRHGER